MINFNYFAYLCVCALLLSTNTWSQVGINTTAPEGILDVTSTTQGVVFPRVSLTSTAVASPVLNPQGGSIKAGTVVYNTNTTSTGTNDVHPGIYVWDGSKWLNKFPKKQSEIFFQTSWMRPKSNASGGYESVPNLTGKSFTAEFTGKYKIEVSVNYGGGYITDASTGTDVGSQTGTFRFRFDGTDHFITAKTNCSLTDTGTKYYAIWQQHFYVYYIDLVAGSTYNFELRFDQDAAPGFENSGNSGNGRGHIGIPDHAPCSVEFTYLGS